MFAPSPTVASPMYPTWCAFTPRPIVAFFELDEVADVGPTLDDRAGAQARERAHDRVGFHARAFEHAVRSERDPVAQRRVGHLRACSDDAPFTDHRATDRCTPGWSTVSRPTVTVAST